MNKAYKAKATPAKNPRDPWKKDHATTPAEQAKKNREAPILKLPTPSKPLTSGDVTTLFIEAAQQFETVGASVSTTRVVLLQVNEEVQTNWPNAVLTVPAVDAILAQLPPATTPAKKTHTNRQVWLAGIAGYLHKRKVPRSIIATALIAENVERCSPVLSFAQLDKLLTKTLGFDPDMTGLDDILMTDTGNSQRFADDHRGHIIYCPQLTGNKPERWLLHDGKRWKQDAGGGAQQLVVETLNNLEVEEELRSELYGEPYARTSKNAQRWVHVTQSEKSRGAMLRLAAHQKGIHRHINEFDQDKNLLNVQNGVVDLRTGKLLPHSNKQLNMRIAGVPYVPGAVDPKWESFLDHFTQGDKDVRAFLQRLVGYSLGGDPVEEVVTFFHGKGGGGKGTFINTIEKALGSYAMATPFDTFTVKLGSGIPNDIARMAGARVVFANEGKTGARVDTALMKAFSGRDTLSARFLYSEHFDFRPRAVLFLCTNDMPHISGSDTGVWRRIIRFPVSGPPKVVDTGLKTYLETNPIAPFAWAVEGYRQWQAEGLAPPASITISVTKYREDEDTFGYFLEDCCRREPGGKIPTSHIMEAYIAWHKRRIGGSRPMSIQAMTAEMLAAGFERARVRFQGVKKRCWIGIKSVEVLALNNWEDSKIYPAEGGKSLNDDILPSSQQSNEPDYTKLH